MAFQSAESKVFDTDPDTAIETVLPTESETEPPTEAETEPQTFTLDTTVDEENATRVEFDTIRVMYALDDLNVRSEPGTSDTSEIFSSYANGDQINVVGETTNWYMVSVDGYADYGFVYKGYVGTSEDSSSSDTGVDDTGAADTTVSETTADSDAAASTTDTSSVDLEYGVETYAESFTITATAGANMRAEPSQDGEIIGTIASETQVTAIGYTDRWYKISYNGAVGYVNKNLFSAE